jgi:hypothetical protein
MYHINEKVKRKEDRSIVGAIVRQVLPDKIYFIEYDEGGFGFWSEEYLERIIMDDTGLQSELDGV